MTDRCWDELYRAGKALAEDPDGLRGIGEAVVRDFELPRSPEVEAGVSLEGLRDAFEVPLVELLLPEAAE